MSAEAVIGWYNGEWQPGMPGPGTWYLGPDNFRRAYDEFEVPPEGWTVVGVFSENALYVFPWVTHAHWEIRRGMSPGHGGKVVAHGLSQVSLRPNPTELSIQPVTPASGETTAPLSHPTTAKRRFTLRGETFEKERSDFLRVMEGKEPGRIQKYSTVIDGKRYPIRQVVASVTNLSAIAITSQDAYRILSKFNFIVESNG
jgi:hypothetical protein